MSHFVHVTSEEHFGGSRFNGHIMEHCTFLFVDEGVYAGDKKTVSRVKGIVTESKQMVERKGISRRVPRAELSAHLGGDEPRLGRPDGARLPVLRRVPVGGFAVSRPPFPQRSACRDGP